MWRFSGPLKPQTREWNQGSKSYFIHSIESKKSVKNSEDHVKVISGNVETNNEYDGEIESLADTSNAD